MEGGGYFANFGALALFGFEVAVSLLQERSLVHGALGPTFASEQKDERVKRDAQVEPERRVVDDQARSKEIGSKKISLQTRTDNQRSSGSGWH
jgi:hypothetical protein